MHANGAEEVVYAGELSIRRREDDDGVWKYVVILDNNSGTYAPDAADLHLVREVFARNFASERVVIEAHERESPALNAYVESINVEGTVGRIPDALYSGMARSFLENN